MRLLLQLTYVHCGEETNISDPRSYEHYWASIWNKAWKKFRPVRDLNSYPVRQRCSALPTELTSQPGAGHYAGSQWTIQVVNNDCKYMKIIYVHCGEETNISDPRSYEHYWTSSWNKTWKKFRPARDLNPWPPRTGLNVSLLVQAARIAHIRFLTAMHIYDFNIFTVK